MEEPRQRPQDPNDPGRPRGRSVLLVILPVAFLGIAYFLFVEYVLRELAPAGSDLRLTLRLGGIGLIALALILAAACGYLLFERLMRPLRWLLRVVESGEVPPGRPALLHGRGTEYHDLHRTLSMLISQNKSGARAMEELDHLRGALARFREDVARTGLHGIPPEVMATGPLREIGANLQAKRTHLLAFFGDLRERVRNLHAALESLGERCGFSRDGSPGTEAELPGVAPSVGAAAEVRDDAPIRASLERLRRLGTVLALESAHCAGAPAVRATELLARFEAGLGDLEAVLRIWMRSESGDNGGTPEGGQGGDLPGEAQREAWRRLLDGIDALERRLAEVEER